MNSRFIIIAILIFIKVIGVASRARADFLCNDYAKGYGYSYTSDGLNEWRQKSIHKFAEDSKCNERFNNFLKSKGIF